MAEARVHPNDMPMLEGVASGSGPFRVKMSVKSTGQDKGWLGVSANNWVDLVHDRGSAALCEWTTSGGNNYLRVNNATVNRYLGMGYGSYATWGMETPSGQWRPIAVRDGIMYIADDPNPYALYPSGNDWVCWGNNNTIMKFEEDRG